MTQAQATLKLRFADRFQLYIENRSYESIYGPCAFVFLSAVYFYATAASSWQNEFWMDDVVAAQTAQLPSARAIIDAIWGGQEMSPPTYYLSLHFVLPLMRFWPIQVAARFPSTLAAYGAAVVIFILLRRRMDIVVSLFSFGIMLSMGLFPFAGQVREYAFLVLFLSLALLFWDNIENSKHPKLNGLAIWFVLALSLIFHVYGIIPLATIAICEALWIITRRQWRPAVIVPIICLIPVEIAMAPLIIHLSTFSSADVISPNYYAKPTFQNLLHSIMVILFGGDLGITIILVGGLLIFFLYYVRRLIGNDELSVLTIPQRPPEVLSQLEIMMIALALIPILAFLFASLITRSYSERYITGVTLLAPMAAGTVLGRLRDGRIVALLLTPLLLYDLLHKTRPDPGVYGGIIPTLERYTRDSTLPIIIDDAVFYLQALYAADPGMRSRIVLLTTNAQVPPLDPTGQNMMLRTSKYVDYVHVAKLEDFLKTHPRFYLLSEMQSRAVTIVPPLMKACALGPLLRQINGKFLFEAGLSYARPDCDHS